MKNIKRLLVLFLVINAFTSCQKDEVSYALQDVSAPTNINAVFDISQDPVGMVSITPTADGATAFEVYFGDSENETPVQVNPGETISHTYEGEGEYQLKIVAVGLTGLESELIRIVNISFDPPKELAAEVVVADTNPFEVNVTPTAINATVYDVYFGDMTDEEPITIMDGETAMHTYTEAGDYTVRVVARGAGAATSEISKDVTISGASNAIKLPITFDDATVNYDFVTFNGTTFEVVDNPHLSGANSEDSKVGAITNAGNAFEGGSLNLGTPADFSGDNKTITIKMYSEVSVPVLLKLEGGVNGERQNEVVVTHNGTGWEELTFNFATDATKSYIDGSQGVGEPFVPTGQYGTFTLFIDGPGTTAGTFYIDDVVQTGGTSGNAEEPKFPIGFESSMLVYTINSFGAADFGPIPAEIADNPDASGINTSARVLKLTKPGGAQTYAGAGIELEGTVDFSGGTIAKVKVYSPRVGTPVLFKLEDSSSPLDANNNPTISVEVQATTTVANQWEELTFDLTSDNSFSTDNTYDRVILFPDFGNMGNEEEFYFDDLTLGAPEGSDGGSGGETATDPTTAAPTPTLDASKVISMFSDAYDDVPVDTWRAGYSAATLEDVEVAGNATKKYTDLNFVGIETVANELDVSNTTYFHTDIWTSNATEFRIKLVDFGADGTYQGGDDAESEIAVTAPTQGQWVSIDIPLSDFTGLTTKKHIAQLIYSADPSGQVTVYVDNVYFHN